MLPSIIVSAPAVRLPELPPPTPSSSDLGDLLRQLIDVQREQVHLTRGLLAFHDSSPKWKALLTRWQEEFPDVGLDCKRVLPTVERAYMTLLKEVTDRLDDTDADELGNDFTMGEFLDRYGTRLNQLAGMINQLLPLAENALPPPKEEPAEVEGESR